MRTIGQRKERPVGLLASGALLAEGMAKIALERALALFKQQAKENKPANS